MRYNLYYWVAILDEWYKLIDNESEEFIYEYRKLHPNRRYKIEVNNG